MIANEYAKGQKNSPAWETEDGGVGPTFFAGISAVYII